MTKLLGTLIVITLVKSQHMGVSFGLQASLLHIRTQLANSGHEFIKGYILRDTVILSNASTITITEAFKQLN